MKPCFLQENNINCHSCAFIIFLEEKLDAVHIFQMYKKEGNMHCATLEILLDFFS